MILDNNFEALTPAQLKAGIKEKFKTLSRFCIITGIDKKVLNKAFKAPLDQVKLNTMYLYYAQAKVIPDRPIRGELTPELRGQIRRSINGSFKNLREFSRHFPGFTENWLSGVLNQGPRAAKKISKKVYRLMQYLNIQENEN